MSIDWKELDFFGEAKQIPKKVFENMGNVILSNFTRPSSVEQYSASATFAQKLDLSSFPNYKYCTEDDFFIEPYFYISSNDIGTPFPIDYYSNTIKVDIENYNPETGEMTLYAICYPSNKPPVNLKIGLTSITVYSFYDVSVKDLK